MTSFRLRLVFYFMLLAVLPLTVLTWDFARLHGKNERQLVEARLQVDLRAAAVAYQDELARASATAARIAHSRSLARAFAAGDRHALARIARTTGVRLVDRRGRPTGARPARAGVRRVLITEGHRRLGTVEAFVPLDRQLVRRLEHHAGLGPSDRLAISAAGRIVVATAPLSGRVPVTASRPSVAELSGSPFRLLVAPLPGIPRTGLVVLTPEDAVTAATAVALRRLLLGVLAALLFVTGVGYLEGRRIVGAIRSLVSATNGIARGRLDERARVRGRDELATLGHAFNDMAEQLETRLDELNAERARLREVISGFGAALAATHDDEELLRIIVATAVEATAASGGKFVSVDGGLVECGDADAEGERLEVTLAGRDGSFGTLVLVGSTFTSDDTDTAFALAAQATVALENAQLHRIVARQALTDGLTGLDNRRQAETALAGELARIGRYGGCVAVVLADLDGFKRLNDEFGHAAGDTVLREFAHVVRAASRDSDTTARWGGEEFVLLLPETDLDGAARLAERVRRDLEQRTILSPEGVPLRVTASFGVSAQATADGAIDVVAAADAALYAAKRAGKNRVVTLESANPSY